MSAQATHHGEGQHRLRTIPTHRTTTRPLQKDRAEQTMITSGTSIATSLVGPLSHQELRHFNGILSFGYLASPIQSSLLIMNSWNPWIRFYDGRRSALGDDGR
mmetsp:Transcript_52626/g.78617  ORF Transcript_52626/g.78617 Transcript_52626/m.78617 type:complete len:103 (-) Transcript_52626:132-440(-)